MKVITDNAVAKFLNSYLDRNTILDEFRPTLVNSLTAYSTNPDQIVPPRIVQQSNNSNSDTTHVFMPCVSPTEVGIKVISGGPGNNSKGLGFQGCVLVIDEITGQLQAVINANTLTAFRTALASTLGLTKVIDINDEILLPELTVFGVGLQAYWHVKLTLILYGAEKIKTVNIINRSLANAIKLKEKFEKEFTNVQFNGFSNGEEEDDSVFKDHILNSSIIFGCVPVSIPVIKEEYINKDPKWPKFISLIGSYKPHMIELDLDFIKKLKSRGVQIIVDSKTHTLHEAGELIQSEYKADQLIEIHKLYSENAVTKDSSYTDPTTNTTVQKIVGLSIMDLSIGKLIYNKAVDNDIVCIPNF
ncbi:hypothetical protein KGF56_000039 [Candida oxycetoniae]|uniref:Ornithine cyclodeaminase n=1 Tax=Candida oxycetoniae TaxID=497107 RepID=A0AAI9T1W5_9ASCO|nr:uncharacterized protein KGF56_000039 [Candida oxycetoniae]KAI3407137.2 hypothetical protein KGF56_000039 [Candida oxycetoniae]